MFPFWGSLHTTSTHII